MINVSIYLTEFNQFHAKQIGDPTTYWDAIKRPDSKLWIEAMRKEIDTLVERGTWEIVPQPKGHNIVGSKFVYKLKLRHDGSIDKYKARLVAQGYSQVDGLDYFSDDLFAPVARMATVRMALTWC